MRKGKAIAEPVKRQDLLGRLREVQERYGCVPEEVMEELAQSLGIPLHEVYGVASFYSFISTKQLGRNVIRVCKSLPCYLKNSAVIIEAVKKELGIEPGETTADRRFTLELSNCIGLCDHAPAMLVNYDAHGDLTSVKIKKILKEYK
jgi:NADH-quinone oxidoreductase subunit E